MAQIDATLTKATPETDEIMREADQSRKSDGKAKVFPVRLSCDSLMDFF